MTKYIYNQFYVLPLGNIIAYMIILIFLWKLLGEQVQKKTNKQKFWKLLNSLSVAGIIMVIFIITISSRSGSGTDLILTPFHFLIEARTQPELYRSMLMNVFLFFPLGLTFPYALPEKWNRKVFRSILFAMVLSIGIEFAQYHYHLGRAETDDVICNTLGCAIGTLSYQITHRRKKKEHNT